MGFTRSLRAIGSATLTGALVFAAAPHATADDVRDKQWPLSAYDAQSIWKITKGQGEKVAVIDDGVNANHPDLKGNVLKGKDFIDGGSTAPNRGDVHGTGMAATIAGHGHGVNHSSGIMGLAPKAKILPIRDQGRRSDGYASSIHYAVDHGASVINISQKQDAPLDRDAESKAIAYALKRNVLVVAGTGNDGGPVGYPAAYPGVLAVSGVQRDGTAWPKANSGSRTVLSAPATDILSAGGPSDPDGYGIGSGTSEATAYTSAAAALLRVEYPDLTAGQVANRLTKSAGLPESEKGLKVPDKRYGYGYIQPLAALKRHIPAGSEYGPLSVPESMKQGASTRQESAAQQKAADQKAVLLWCVTGAVILVALGVIAFVVVRINRRRKNRNGSGGYGPGGYGPPGASAGYPHQSQTSHSAVHGQRPPGS